MLFFTIISLLLSIVLSNVQADGINWCPETNGLSQNSREMVLDGHNHFRSIVARGLLKTENGVHVGQVSDMKEMTYDCQLEDQARKWAKRCVFEHSRNDGHTYGENLYAFYPGRRYKVEEEVVVFNATLDWWNEHKNNSLLAEKSPILKHQVFSEGGGHLTQMLWAETDRLGCGYNFCKRQNMAMVVCLYQPAGNWIDDIIYTSGEVCSNCPQSHSNCSKILGLCRK